MGITLENSSYSPSALGMPGALLLVSVCQGAEWAALKEICRGACVRGWDSTGVSLALQREGKGELTLAGQQTCPVRVAAARGLVLITCGAKDAGVKRRSSRVVMVPAGRWDHSPCGSEWLL